jgi:uncharacterized protein (DUF2141 family)
LSERSNILIVRVDTNMSRRTYMQARAGFIVLVGLSGALAATTAAQPVPSSGLAARVSGLRNDRGQIGCMLFASADGFPREPKKAVERVFVPISGGAGTCTFAAKPGNYAIICMHDENGNGAMDRGAFGIPKEGFGASRRAHGAFGPKFADAQFTYRGGGQTVPITIRY